MVGIHEGVYHALGVPEGSPPRSGSSRGVSTTLWRSRGVSTTLWGFQRGLNQCSGARRHCGVSQGAGSRGKGTAPTHGAAGPWSYPKFFPARVMMVFYTIAMQQMRLSSPPTGPSRPYDLAVKAITRSARLPDVGGGVGDGVLKHLHPTVDTKCGRASDQRRYVHCC